MRRDFTHIRTHSFAGKRFAIVWKKLDKLTDGQCDPPNKLAKKIYIGPNLDEQTLLETVIHESVHAGCWALHEDTVQMIAADATRLLWRMGFRLAVAE